MSIKDRLQMVIKMNSLTNAQFADRVGVQRSSISHIMAGRNKPSLDFIQKTLDAFPKVDAKWLVTGRQDARSEQSDSKDESLYRSSEEIGTDSAKEISQEPIVTEPKSIKRIVVYYDDGSYIETIPELGSDDTGSN
tara:strand:+ start:32714 stop:33121 length:408 start_codon:yes stop_codon:yes gene_type:complete